jgi:predicted MPP superfamily phosphohydrolase
VGVVAIPRWLCRYALRRPPAVLRSLRSRGLLDRAAPALHVQQHPHHFLVHLPGNQTLHLDLSERAIEVPRLPPALDGLVLLHISDFHMSGRVGKPYFQEIVRLSNELHPDLVLLTGDYVDRAECIDWIPDTIGRLSARWGVYCILGNHDVEFDTGRLIRVLEESGLRYIGGRHAQIEVRGLPVVLAGNELPWMGPAADLEHCPPPGKDGPLRIGLAHCPDQLPWARAHQIDLLLAGHTHGGQIRLPLVGPIFTCSRLGVEYAAGVFHVPPTIMHVTRGVSGELPLRWNCAPEIAQLVLHAPAGTSGVRRVATP